MNARNDAIPIRPITEQLIDAAILDLWPSVTAIADFGIDSESHLGALQFAIRHGLVTPQELDAAMGDGEKLTEIVQRGENPYRDVTFRTAWDGLPLDEPAWHDTEARFAEIRADEYAARVRDYGAEDAATYEQRVRDGAAVFNHVPPEPLTEAELEKVVSELERSWPPVTDKTQPADGIEPDGTIFDPRQHGQFRPQQPSSDRERDQEEREL